MVESEGSLNSIKSFIFGDEERNLCKTKEPRRVEITVEPEENVTDVGTKLPEIGPEISEIPYITLTIEKALNLDLKNASYDKILSNNIQLRCLLCKTKELIKEREELNQNLEKQIKTLQLENDSLKALLSITKDLLSTKNLEVLDLNEKIRNMEESNKNEREKHKTVLLNMNEAVNVISKMKEEHKLQLDLSVELQEGYKRKIELLEKENKLLSCQFSEEFLISKAVPIIIEKAGEGDTMSSGSD